MTAVPTLYEQLAPAVGTLGETAVAGLDGPRTWWAGPLDVEGLALGSVQAALSSAQLLFGPLARFFSDSGSICSAFNSLACLRVDGRAPEGFAPLSGYFPTSDGWVRLHANYPQHEQRLCRWRRETSSFGGSPSSPGTTPLNASPGPEASRWPCERSGRGGAARWGALSTRSRGSGLRWARARRRACQSPAPLPGFGSATSHE